MPNDVTQPGPAPATNTTTADGFRPVQGGTVLQSGEKLLVEAYAAIWLILFALILMSWRRQKRTDDRIAQLEVALEKARRAEAASAEGGT